MEKHEKHLLLILLGHVTSSCDLGRAEDCNHPSELVAHAGRHRGCLGSLLLSCICCGVLQLIVEWREKWRLWLERTQVHDKREEKKDAIFGGKLVCSGVGKG